MLAHFHKWNGGNVLRRHVPMRTSNSIREAIEALADGLRNRRAADGSAYECGLQNQAQSVAHLLLDILAAHPEPPREELREALRKIIEWCDGTRGADFNKAPFEAIGDCARAALSRGPAKETDNG
jgi:hypothetical protein